VGVEMIGRHGSSESQGNRIACIASRAGSHTESLFSLDLVNNPKPMWEPTLLAMRPVVALKHFD
jgi:hypothetical protein